jgi:hypothetical protein
MNDDAANLTFKIIKTHVVDHFKPLHITINSYFALS